MSAECDKHGVDLQGHEFSPGGLTCPVCEREVESDALRAENARFKDALTEIAALTEIWGGRMPGEVSAIHEEAQAALEGRQPA